MDLFGMGALEVMIILLVAIVVLGPAKTIGMAKNAGKMLGQARKVMGDLSKAVEEEERQIRAAADGLQEKEPEGRRPPEERR